MIDGEASFSEKNINSLEVDDLLECGLQQGGRLQLQKEQLER